MSDAPKIVVLDGNTLNPGDLSWDAFSALGDVTVHERTPREQVPERAAGAPIILTNKAILDRANIEQLPDLRYIGVTATGYNVVDLDAARDHGIIVTNIPEYGTESVAQMVFAHLLEHTNHLAVHDVSVKKGAWGRSADFCYWLTPLVELSGLTMGVVGYGRIGQAVARIALAFGMNVLLYDVNPPAGLPDGATATDLDILFRESDVVTLHCPLTSENENLIDAARLAMMKPSALLINTSRGPLVDPQALTDALNRGVIAGAGMDVLVTEPPPPDNPLLTARNITITPHMAWGTLAARSRLMDVAVENVRAFLAGSPINTVG
jgi:glycerate dehydrogenase